MTMLHFIGLPLCLILLMNVFLGYGSNLFHQYKTPLWVKMFTVKDRNCDYTLPPIVRPLSSMVLGKKPRKGRHSRGRLLANPCILLF